MRTLIVGAGRPGALLAGDLAGKPNAETAVVGFAAEGAAGENGSPRGTPVLGPIDRLPRIIAEHGIRQVILALPEARGQTIRRIVAGCKGTRVRIQILPPSAPLEEGSGLASLLRPMLPADLLGRPEVQVDRGELRRFFAGKAVLITGAAGSIGSELARQVAACLPAKLFLLGLNEQGLDDLNRELWKAAPDVPAGILPRNIREREAIRHTMLEHRPSVVLHAAAHKHVPLMEEQAAEAVKNNVFGTRNVAEAALEAGCEAFLLLSSRMAADPRSVLGATKRAAELVVRALNAEGKTRFASLRLCNVLGSAASVSAVFQEQLRRGAPLTVTHPDMRRDFVSVPDAAGLSLAVLAKGPGELCALDPGDPIRILELAEGLITIAGKTAGSDARIEFTGLRPGESLSDVSPSGPGETSREIAPGVLSIDSPPPADGLPMLLDRLEAAAQASDHRGCVEIMRELVARQGPAT
jgi:FlaA1/EpsC-like NDP-sugar epimerase